MKRFGGTTMFVHNHDRHCDQDRAHPPPHQPGPRCYSVAVPAHCLDEHGCLIDQLIQFAFDTLGAQHLDLRVYEAK
jgi:hypothetical protein